jgi:glycogen operon protein
LANPPILWDIDNDPILAGTKMIAEAWDAAGLYQVGSFVGDHWKEWNGHFRDDMRSFVKSDPGLVETVASRLFGSPDIYGMENRGPEQSINFITCHDGFTLNDLVSYNEKHNQANGEGNRDGHNENCSWNCGVEGPTTDPAIEQLRERQIKNFLAISLLALGSPMLLMGDEVRRTQLGNNNAYCQDNRISWYDWRLHSQHPGVFRFAQEVIRLRLALNLYREVRGLSLIELLAIARIERHGVMLNEPDSDHQSHTVAVSVAGTRDALYVICNAYWEPLEFALPAPPFPGASAWRRVMDTFLPSPADIASFAEAPIVTGSTYTVQPRTCVLLAAERPK